MYLFCVRHFNDVDHITPVVWRMKHENYPVAVYCINPRYDIENDYRLKFLKEQGITVESIYDAFAQKMNGLYKAMRYLFQWSYAKGNKFSSQRHEKSLPLSRLSELAVQSIGRVLYELTRICFYRKYCRPFSLNLLLYFLSISSLSGLHCIFSSNAYAISSFTFTIRPGANFVYASMKISHS